MQNVIILVLLACCLQAQIILPDGELDPNNFVVPNITEVPIDPTFNSYPNSITGLYSFTLGFITTHPVNYLSNPDRINITFRYNPSITSVQTGIYGYHPNWGTTYIFLAVHSTDNFSSTLTPFGYIGNYYDAGFLVEFIIDNSPPIGYPLICPQYRWVPTTNQCPIGSGDPFGDVAANGTILVPGIGLLVGSTFSMQMLWFVPDQFQNYFAFATKIVQEQVY